MMKHISVLRIFSLYQFFLAYSSDSFSQQRPNIIIILADDMGYSDLGCYGSEMPTPNLNALAAKEVRLTQLYNNARCVVHKGQRIIRVMFAPGGYRSHERRSGKSQIADFGVTIFGVH